MQGTVRRFSKPMSLSNTVIKLRKPIFISLDVFAVLFSMLLSVFIAEGFSIPRASVMAVLNYAPINILLTLFVFALFKLYRRVLSLASAAEFFDRKAMLTVESSTPSSVR